MYNVIDEQNMVFDELPRNGSLINFSMLRDLKSTPVVFRSFSIKYVLEGCENYTINGQRFQVQNDHYLLANTHSDGAVEIDSEKIVKAICIDIAPDILSEVVGSYLEPGSGIADPNLDRFFTTSDFFESFYPSDQTLLGKTLNSLGSELSHSPFEKHQFSKEFYYHLSEQLLTDHIPIFKQLQSVSSVKAQTKKELLRRVLRGKEYINACYMLPLSIEQVARECHLSEYHFFRLFKAVMGISPHQYLIRKRIENAHALLSDKSHSVSDVAFLCGFADVFSFSKAFKKHTGTPPSLLLKQ
ncbi:MAG TPA: AraC family transcriptional regulator [Fluviicola sp.]|nr:AraC family transcriptional regulator [Fluviicola sp.]